MLDLLYFQAPDIVSKLSSESAILTVVFIAAGLAILKLLPGLIVAFRPSNGNAAAERERADQVLAVIVSNTTAVTANTAAVAAQTSEIAGLRAGMHGIRELLSVYEKRLYELEKSSRPQRPSRLQ